MVNGLKAKSDRSFYIQYHQGLEQRCTVAPIRFVWPRHTRLGCTSYIAIPDAAKDEALAFLNQMRYVVDSEIVKLPTRLFHRNSASNVASLVALKSGFHHQYSHAILHSDCLTNQKNSSDEIRHATCKAEFSHMGSLDVPYVM